MLTRRLAILSIVALGSLAVLATSPSAYAERKSPGNPTPVASGNRISVTVTGTGVKGVSGGTGGRSHTVPVPVPCMLTQGMTGKAYFDYI
jgi:hypothetical protein